MTVLFRILASLILILKNFDPTLQLAFINVALNRPAVDCNNKPITAITDGNTDDAIPVGNCAHSNMITVRLNFPYQIIYMKIYLGAEYEDMDEHPLDFFFAHMETSGNQRHDCAEYGKKIKMIKDHTLGITINCKVSRSKYRAIHLSSESNKNYSIAEFEAYSYDETMKDVMIHRGCYTGFPLVKLEKSYTNISQCYAACAKQQWTALLAVNQKKQKCKCLADYDEALETDLEKCDVLIPGTDFYGGGDDTYSLYLIILHLPQSIGCSDDLNAHTTHELSDISVSKCASICQNFSQISIQNLTCGCLATSIGTDWDLVCDIPCTGGDEYLCGGEGTASVYSTCVDIQLKSPTCIKLFQCKDGLFNELGHCLEGCKENYLLEPFCFERKPYGNRTITERTRRSRSPRSSRSSRSPRSPKQVNMTTDNNEMSNVTTKPRSGGSTQRLTLIQSWLFFLAELIALNF